MPQAGEDFTTPPRERVYAPCFDFAERKALTEWGFHFESYEGHEAAEIKGRCTVMLCPPSHDGEEFAVTIILPTRDNHRPHAAKKIVWENA